jgi:hypothetical protein
VELSKLEVTRQLLRRSRRVLFLEMDVWLLRDPGPLFDTYPHAADLHIAQHQDRVNHELNIGYATLLEQSLFG